MRSRRTNRLDAMNTSSWSILFGTSNTNIDLFLLFILHVLKLLKAYTS
jgi:hypothetical protein